MYASAWTDRLASLRERLDQLQSARRPTETVDPWDAADDAVASLRELAELAGQVDRFPTLETPPDEPVERAVRSVLRAKLDGGPVDPETVSRAGDRIVEYGTEWRVPLGEDADDRNLYVVFSWTGSRLQSVTRGWRRMQRRFDALEEPRLAAAYTELGEATEALATRLRVVPTVALWLAPPEGLADVAYEELESFAKRTLEATESDQCR